MFNNPEGLRIDKPEMFNTLHHTLQLGLFSTTVLLWFFAKFKIPYAYLLLLSWFPKEHNCFTRVMPHGVNVCIIWCRKTWIILTKCVWQDTHEKKPCTSLLGWLQYKAEPSLKAAPLSKEQKGPNLRVERTAEFSFLIFQEISLYKAIMLMMFLQKRICHLQKSGHTIWAIKLYLRFGSK